MLRDNCLSLVAGYLERRFQNQEDVNELRNLQAG